MMQRERRARWAKVTVAAAALMGGAATAAAQDIDVEIGDLPPGKSVTIIYDVQINDPFGGEDEVSNQGIVSGGNFADFPVSATTPVSVTDSDGDGVPDDEDQCPASDLSETVVIGGCDSGVTNASLDEPAGCTVTDLIDREAASARNHGQFVSAVARLLNRLRQAGVISGTDREAIQSCAAEG